MTKISSIQSLCLFYNKEIYNAQIETMFLMNVYKTLSYIEFTISTPNSSIYIFFQCQTLTNDKQFLTLRRRI